MITFVYDTESPGPIPIDVTPDQVAALTQAITHARITGSVGSTYTHHDAFASVERLYTSNGGRSTATDLWLVKVQGGPPHLKPLVERLDGVVHDAIAAALATVDGQEHERWAELDPDDRVAFADALRPVLPVLIGAVRS